MELPKNVGNRGRVARTIIAAVLAAVAFGSLRKGKRLSGALAGAGALALGYSATAGRGELPDAISIEATSDDGELRCAICGQPIRPGQRRGPNEEGDTVHDACKE